MIDSSYLAQLTQPRSVYIIRSEHHAPSFMHLIVQALARISQVPLIRSINLASEEGANITQRLAMSFLGVTEFYYLTGAQELSDKKIEQLRALLASYQGPHIALLALTKEDNKEFGDGILLTQEPTLQETVQLLALLEQQEQVRARIELFFTALYKRGYKFSLDEIARLLPYAQLVGARVDEFAAAVLPKVIASDHTLFELATAFFARDTETFKTLYEALAQEFQTPFWLTYFSEQAFRAYWYIVYKHAGKLVEAQKIGYRLPFSFLQKDWRHHDKDALLKLHDRLYQCDSDFKLGASEQCIELLLLSYMNKTAI